MKKIALILALIIIVGVAVLLLTPEPTVAPTQESITAPVTSTTDDEQSADIEISTPTPQTAAPGDAGMEFPIPDAELETYSALVTYTSNGFEPKTLTVSRGETVRFLNQSEQKMWVGANNHPTHALYPITSPSDCLGSSFDQCVGVDAGVFWDFTFTETGTFGYHNHLRARDGGSIVVE